MGKQIYSSNFALILWLALLTTLCAANPPRWGPPLPPLPETPAISPDKLAIDCEALAADSSIPGFLVKELCGGQPVETTTQNEVEGEENNDAEGETEAAEQVESATEQEAVASIAKDQAETREQVKTEDPGSDGAQDPSQVLVPFFRGVIQKLISTDRKVPAREFWVEAYKEAGAPKLSRHPSFFEVVAGLQQSVESFRSEGSWSRVVRRLKDLTSDDQWERLESALSAAHGRDSGALWRVVGAAKALRAALKSSVEEPQCRVEGPNPDPEDCREFYICFRFLGRWKSKDVECPRGTEFSPSRRRCVWAPLSNCQVSNSDSDEDSSSDEDSNSNESDESSEILERILKHGPAAFHAQ